MTTSRILGVVLALGLLVGATACSNAKPIAKADYIKKADAICKADAKVITARSKAITSATTTPTKAQINAFYTFASTRSLGEITAVRALGYPKGDKAELDKAFAAFEKVFRELQAHPEKASTISSTSTKGANKTMKDYGFKTCGV